MSFLSLILNSLVSFLVNQEMEEKPLVFYKKIAIQEQIHLTRLLKYLVVMLIFSFLVLSLANALSMRIALCRDKFIKKVQACLKSLKSFYSMPTFKTVFCKT